MHVMSGPVFFFSDRSCNSGGDCECMCDAIAAFSSRCSEIGYPVRWRHQKLCRKSKRAFVCPSRSVIMGRFRFALSIVLVLFLSPSVRKLQSCRFAAPTAVSVRPFLLSIFFLSKLESMKLGYYPFFLKFEASCCQ